MSIGVGIGTGPEPDGVLSEAASVEVYECVGASTRYSIRYDIDIVDGDFPALSDSKLGPGSVLTLQVAAGAAARCLVKGPVRGQSVRFRHGGGGSFLEVRGADTTLTMDREARERQWPSARDCDVVKEVLGGYFTDAIVADTDSLHEEAHHTIVQCETDLSLVRRLAHRNGMLLWLTYGEGAVEKAHFAPPPLESAPAANLSINEAADSNIRSFALEWDTEHPTSVGALQLNPRTKKVMDASSAVSSLPPLGKVGFASVAGGTRRSRLTAAVDDAGDLGARARAIVEEASFFVTAECDTTLEDLGSLVRAHQVVQVDGLGTRHSGKYFVRAVHHLINPRGHHMHLSLARNGWEA